MSINIYKYQIYSKKLMIGTALLIVLSTIIYITYDYAKSIETSETSELNRLAAIAKTLAVQIDGEKHKALICKYNIETNCEAIESDPYYIELNSLLKTVQFENDIHTPIYTLYKNNSCNEAKLDKESLVFGVTSANCLFQNVWEKVPDDHFTFYEQGLKINQYTTVNGNWLSAFHPIRDDNKETVAILQIDRTFDIFITAAKKDALVKSLYSLLILLGLGGLIFYYSQKVLSFMKEINNSLNEKVKEKTIELESSNEALKTLNIELDKKVKARTLALEGVNEQLTDSNDRLEHFAFSVTHDLKAPIKNANILSKLIEERYQDKLDSQGKEFINHIVKITDNMSTLVSEILSRATNDNEAENKMMPIDLNEIVEEIKLNLSYDIKKVKATVTYRHLPTIIGYRSDFIQLFHNFILNSINYRRDEVSPVINISASVDGKENYLIYLEDNGKGISPEAQQTIFEEFNRGDESSSDGHGIGLNTCIRIIKDYDGSIDVDSELNVGTTFTIKMKDYKKVELHPAMA